MDDTPPPVQFTQTADGIRIAYWSIGHGEPLIQLPSVPFSHIEFEWRMSRLRRSYQLLSVRRKLVRYDGRGTGLSQRGIDDFSLDGLVMDLDAAVQVAGQPCALIATFHASMIAMAYAARNPEKVSALLLWCPVAQGARDFDNPNLKAVIWLWENDWELYRRTAAHAFMGWSEPDAAKMFADYIDAAVEPQEGKRLFDAIHETDVLNELPLIQCPTLVMYRPAMPFAQPDVIEDIAARIPRATTVTFDGTEAIPYVGDWRAAARTIYGFLGITAEMIGDRDRQTLRLISRRNEALTDRERDVVAHDGLFDNACINSSSLRKTIMDPDCILRWNGYQYVEELNIPQAWDSCGINHKYYDPNWGYAGC